MLDFLSGISADHPVLAPFVFIALRALAIIIPPIPGGAFDLAGLALFGWVEAFIYAEIGMLLGAIVSFAIARKWREPITRRFVPLEQIEEWRSKLSERQEFWTLVGLRLVSNPFFDYISYVAGLTRMRTSTFILVSFLGTLPQGFIFFYVGGRLFRSGAYQALAFISIIVALWAGWKFLLGKKTDA